MSFAYLADSIGAYQARPERFAGFFISAVGNHMTPILVIALTLVCGVAVVITWQAVMFVLDVIRETIAYLFRFDES